MKPIQKDNTS